MKFKLCVNCKPRYAKYMREWRKKAKTLRKGKPMPKQSIKSK